MAVSMATSKLLNLRSPALQSLIRRQLLHPSASSHLLQSTSTSPTLFLLENGNIELPDRSPNARNLNSQWPFGSSVMQIEAARTYVPSGTKDDVYEDFDDDDDDDDEDDDHEDNEGDIQNYSGSDHEDDDASDDVDEDPDARPPGRSYRK